MTKFLNMVLLVAGMLGGALSAAWAEESVFMTAHLIPDMRAMLGKPLLGQTIEFSNRTPFVLASLAPEGSRLFYGGNHKEPGETADDMRLRHRLVVLITPCPGASDLSAKIANVAVWELISLDETDSSGRKSLQEVGLGTEQLLAMMNAPPGVVTPSTLRVPRVKNLHGPVFEYVRGDATETLSLLNEGAALRINWTTANTGACPR